jgi:hypothetical protein
MDWLLLLFGVLYLLGFFMKLRLPSGPKIGWRRYVVPDIVDVEPGRVFELAAPILGDQRIHIFQLIHDFLPWLKVGKQLAGFGFGNPPLGQFRQPRRIGSNQIESRFRTVYQRCSFLL